MSDQKTEERKCSLFFIGETEVGKSTLLQSFKDFINRVKFENISTTPKSTEIGKSQTKYSSKYLLSNNQWLINIFDTPGIGDTNDCDTGQKNFDNIINNVGKYGEFNAVCILISRGTTRATKRLKYIIGELKAQIPINNFIVVITRADILFQDKDIMTRSDMLFSDKDIVSRSDILLPDTLKVIESLGLPIDNIVPINNCAYEELDLSEYKVDGPIRKRVKELQRKHYYANHGNINFLLKHACGIKIFQGCDILSLQIKRDQLKEEFGLLKTKIDDSFEIQNLIQESNGQKRYQFKKRIKGLENDRERLIKSIKERDKEIKSITIIGDNERFSSYINECITAVNRDPQLTNELKRKKTEMFKDTLKLFETSVDKVKKKKICSLLFVGETGVGKSTLLKSFQDFINDAEYQDVKVTPKCAPKGQSQTQQSSQYQLSNDEWEIDIIDTPGIGDTRGIQTDQEHLDNIIVNIGQFRDFNAVCILITRLTQRLTTRLKYIIGELKAHMPKNAQNNFMVIITKADIPIPYIDTLKVIKKLQLPIDNIIPINNCSYEELDLSRYGTNSPIRKMVKQRQKDDYYQNHENLQLLLEHAYKMKPYQIK